MDQNRHSANKKKAKRAEMNGKVSHMPYKYEKLSEVLSLCEDHYKMPD